MYYIILDGYARADTLKQECHFDNSEFLEQLQARGFYVADQSCSNYPMTFMSLASSMNLCYLDESMTKAGGFGLVWSFLDRCAVAHLFQAKGYRFIYFATNFKKEYTGADIALQPKSGWLLSQFSEELLRTTALRLFEPQMADQHLYEFANLQWIPQLQVRSLPSVTLSRRTLRMCSMPRGTLAATCRNRCFSAMAHSGIKIPAAQRCGAAIR